MLIKLAFKNVGKSYKDYGVYFFTLGFGVCVFYIFNSVYAHQGILAMHEEIEQAMQWLKSGLHSCSILVSIIFGFLIIYTNGYFMRRRKKELGIYMTLGMSKMKISIVYVLETSVVASLALVIGLFMGIFLSQFMAIFTAIIFETQIENYYLVISLDAIIKCIVTFGLIFMLVISSHVFSISRYKLVDFLYGDKKSRKLNFHNPKIAALILVLGLSLISFSYVGLIKHGFQQWNLFLGSLFLIGAIGTVLIFYSITGLIMSLIRRKKKWYYKDLNMFLCRQLNHNMNANYILLSIVCFTIYLTISIFVLGYSIQSVVSNEIKETICFDLSFYESLEDKEKLIEDKLYGFLDTCSYAGEYESHYVYYDKDQSYLDFSVLPKRSDKILKKAPILFLKESEFNQIRKMQGMETISLDRKSVV